MKQNILIIHADQHRQDCIGAYGNRDVKTPNIDSLAKEGVRYDRHYTVYPVCTPSRYSFFSGLYVHQHTAWSNHATLPSGTKTFPRILKENGYHTVACGKMHFTPTYQDIGFEKMILAEQNGDGRYQDDYHTYLMNNGLIDKTDLTDQVDDIRKNASEEYFKSFGAIESDLPLEHHSTSWITRQALAELSGWTSEGGSLLFVGYVKPHHPFDPPAPYSTMYNPDEISVLDGYTNEIPQCDRKEGFFDYTSLDEQALRRVTANYYGSITHIDDSVGEMLSLLKEKGLYDQTTIIYTSDHGDYLGFHHMLLKGNFLYEPLAKIPLIIKFPKNSGICGETSALSENIDVMPTILKLCGIDLPASAAKINLADLNNGRTFAFCEGQYGTEEHPRLGYMLVKEDKKLIVDGSLERCMLFDLKNDKNELNNLFGNSEYKEDFDSLKNCLIEKMLFNPGGKNHLDENTPSVLPKETTEKRMKEVTAFIKERLS